MRKHCNNHCDAQITCSCCNLKFSCICSLHVHLIHHKHVLKYLIDTESCLAEIVEENRIERSLANTEIQESSNTRDCSISFVTNNITHDDNLEKLDLENASETTYFVNTEDKSRLENYKEKLHVYCIDNGNGQTGHAGKAEDDSASEDNELATSREEYDNHTEFNLDTAEKDRSTFSKHRHKHASKKNKSSGGLKGQTPSSNIEVPCDTCGYMFKRRNLKRHMQSHSTTKEFKCEICQKFFRTESSLHCHRLHHRTEKDLICHFCGKQFNNGPNLRQHIKSHTRERTLKCPLCPKMFRSNYVLKDHLSRHSGEKPHTCTICNRSFRKPQEVKRHMTFHSETRNHVCRICNKKFKSKSNRIKHEKIHDRKKGQSLKFDLNISEG